MRFFFILGFLSIVMMIGGCHSHDHSKEDPATTHLKNYLRLKKKNPDSALVELRQHAKLAFNSHPKAPEWAQIASRLDRAEKASLPDMLQLSRLNLEIARDNNVSAEYLEILESKVLVWEEIENELNTEGRDPKLFFIEFRFKIEENQ